MNHETMINRNASLSASLVSKVMNMREVAMLTSVILIAGTLYAPAGEAAQASSAATKTLAITSRGGKTGYQMQFLRLRAGEGTDSVSGSNEIGRAHV